MQSFQRIAVSRLTVGILGLLAGVVIVLGIRFVMYKPANKVHYHANFAVYINGQREQFRGPAYYAETKLCQVNTVSSPIERAHMHNNVNSVVHVHDAAVTWGQFFANLNWTLGPDLLESPDGTIYDTNGASRLHVLLNNRDVTDTSNISNDVIRDQDRLLLSYGDLSDTELQRQYDSVPSTAHTYDVTQDPSSCSGNSVVSLSERLHHLF